MTTTTEGAAAAVENYLESHSRKATRKITTESRTWFGDGTYRFFLPMPQINEIEEKHGSVAGLEYRLRQSIGLDEHGKPVFTGGGEVSVKAMRAIIFNALVGGGEAMIDGEKAEIGPQRAQALLDRFLYPAGPIEDMAALAWDILATVMYGKPVEDEPATDAPAQPSPSARTRKRKEPAVV